MRNGLRQGCTLAPTLFNIYFSAVVASWRDGCVEAGVDVLFRHRRKLVGDRTAKSRLDVVRVTESQFADDVAIYAGSRDKLESVAVKFTSLGSERGMVQPVSGQEEMVERRIRVQLTESVKKKYLCGACGRNFRCQSDLTRHTRYCMT